MPEITLRPGDCLDVVRCLDDNSIDSVVTDPPYALVSIVERFGKEGAKPARGDVYARGAAGFMGKKWDTGETAFSIEFWTEVLRVLKPGGHVAAFGGTRSYHRLACAIEDAGFEIRDQLAWVYGTGFPKSHNVSKGIPATDAARQWEGWGTALKPAWEPICFARKPLSEKTVAANVLRWGTGAINVDGCRIEGTKPDTTRGASSKASSMVGTLGAQGRITDDGLGRWPANLCHDGSDEVLTAFPAPGCANSGSAARFFYSAKAGKADRAGSKHPTVKPIKLMQWLVRLITPPKGVVLDPFAGSGTTGAACHAEGRDAILIEREAEYQADIRNRLADLVLGDLL